MAQGERGGRGLLVVGAVVTVVSVLALGVLLLQPWASCPGIDDSSAGCPVEGPQATIQAAVMVAAVVGVVLLGAGAVRTARAGREPAADGGPR